MGLFNTLRGRPKQKMSERERLEKAISVAGVEDPLSSSVIVDTYPLVAEFNSMHLRYIRDKDSGLEFLQFYGVFQDNEVMLWSTCTVVIDGERLTGPTQTIKSDADAEMNWIGGYDGVLTEHVVIEIPMEYITRLAGSQVRWTSQQTGTNRDFTIGEDHANAFANVVARNMEVTC